MQGEEEQKANPVDEYLARITKSVRDAERHLEVPPGTILSIRDEPDFIATVKTYAVIEPMLNDLIVKTVAPSSPAQTLLNIGENFRTFVTRLNMDGRVSKLSLAEPWGLLPEHQINFIKAVTRVRNRYAHNVKNMHRSLAEMLAEMLPKDAAILKNLTGLQDDIASAFRLDSADADLVKVLMYHRLAGYLAHVLNTLPPPPLPTGGIFGTLSATEDGDTAAFNGEMTPKNKGGQHHA